MRTSMSNSGRRTYYSIRETAWILGIDRSMVSRWVRLGTLRTEPHGGRRMIPARELARLLIQPTRDDQQPGGSQ